ncbi:BRCA1-associated protein [Seminavis robusta]|uniref:BRCA1-associated protein n=1 Tax=Seminavis robusta TaxID=568900 RepID=A0A9N8HIU4_9STRA|nr:BRCA1-associated protein [Seminavis robusta]|eukprot:Sro810_g205700.1 BRCA1-associated protein (626) ;mRNA; r:7916-9793
MFAAFSLEVVMDGYKEEKSNKSSSPSTLIATACSVRVSREHHDDPRSQQFLAVMVPHTMVESSLRRTVFDRSNNKKNIYPRNSKCLWLAHTDRTKLSRDLLPRLHPIFNRTGTASSNNNSGTSSNKSNKTSNNNHQSTRNAGDEGTSLAIRAIFTTLGTGQQSPADVVLLDITPPSSSAAGRDKKVLSPSEILQAVNGDCILEEPNAILKVLIISNVHIASSPMNLLASDASLEVPLCPVCLHRISPARLGLPKPLNHHLCSKFCPTTTTNHRPGIAAALVNSDATAETSMGCPKQRFLSPWSEPSNCIACRVIRDYQTVGAGTHTMASVYCNQPKCALHKTLWVCLTCGFCGCGRYSNKHAEAHFLESGHNYSLELATLRIWDYVNGEFVHRGDQLECPAGRQQRARAMQIQQQIAASLGDAATVVPPAAAPWEQQQPYYWDHGDEKSPKKAIMIGEEYEALLQSALEEQAQHYEGEISRLRAALTAEQVDMGSLTKEELEEIAKLKLEIAEFRGELDVVGRDLVDVQAQEAGLRADSQRLLREQQVAHDLLKTIQEESKREVEQGRTQMEELDQQIADLTANLRMRHQFSQNQELTNADIFGTTTDPGRAANKKGKLRRLFRK